METLTLLGAILFGVASGAASSGPLAASLLSDEPGSWPPRRVLYLGFYGVGGLAAVLFLGVIKDLWVSVGVVSAAGSVTGMPLAVVLWTAAAMLAAGTLLKLPLSPWHLLLASQLGVGVAAYWGYAHLDRFASHVGQAVFFGPILAFLLAAAVRVLVAKVATATHLYVYSGAQPLTVVPRGDNPLTSMMALQSVVSEAQDTPVTGVRERTHYREKSRGRPVDQLVEGLRDLGLAVSLMMRGVWDVGVVALALGMALNFSDGTLVAISVCAIALGIVVARGYGASTLVALSGSVSKEASLASSWASAIALPMGAWFGIFFAPSHVACAAFSGAGTIRRGAITRTLGLASVWVASVSVACAMAALTMFLYGKVGG